MNSKEQTMEKIRQKLNEDVALYDCQGDCPDEVAINPDLRTDSYCDKCFAKQLVLIMEQTGYVIIEGDGKGLSENPYYEKWTKTNGSGYRDLMDGFEEGTIAQKALDDKELKARISELEYEIVKLKEKIPTKEEAEAYCRMDNCPACLDSEEYCKECSAAYNNCIAKLLKIAGGEK